MSWFFYSELSKRASDHKERLKAQLIAHNSNECQSFIAAMDELYHLHNQSSKNNDVVNQYLNQCYFFALKVAGGGTLTDPELRFLNYILAYMKSQHDKTNVTIACVAEGVIAAMMLFVCCFFVASAIVCLTLSALAIALALFGAVMAAISAVWFVWFAELSYHNYRLIYDQQVTEIQGFFDSLSVGRSGEDGAPRAVDEVTAAILRDMERGLFSY